jgi:hypothetical protein
LELGHSQAQHIVVLDNLKARTAILVEEHVAAVESMK